MKKQCKFLGLMVIFVLLALTVAACGNSSGPTGASDQNSGTARQDTDSPGEPSQAGSKEELAPLSPTVLVRIAEDGSPSGAGFYIADAKGYFRELGIEVEIKEFESGNDMLPALATGQIDVAGGITGSNLFNAVVRGLDIRMVADKGTNIPGSSYFNLMVRKDLVDQIKEYSDLAGKKIGVFAVGAFPQYLVTKALEYGGLTVDDVEWVTLGPPDLNVAFANKSIDAALQIEPLVTLAEDQGVAVRFRDTTEFLPEGQLAEVLVGGRFVENEEVSKRFMVAYVKGLRDYNDAFLKGKNTEEIIDIMTQYTTLKERDLWKKVAVTGLNPNGSLYEESIRDQYEWFKEQGDLRGEVDLDKIIDHSLVEFAIDYLGKYE